MSEQEKNSVESEMNVEQETHQQTAGEENIESPAESVAEEVMDTDPLEEAILRVQELEQALAESQKKEQEAALRARAEIENMRRRVEQDVEKAHKFALEKFAKDILNTIDNLERALSTATSEEESVKALFDGVELTLKELIATVARFGIEPVGAVGENFDANLHQAISMQPAEGFSSNQITAVLQKGYLLNGRVIRPAMVMVAA